jgi:hypothetical protein
MLLQKVERKKLGIFFLQSGRSLTKIAGSGSGVESGSISQRLKYPRIRTKMSRIRNSLIAFI